MPEERREDDQDDRQATTSEHTTEPKVEDLDVPEDQGNTIKGGGYDVTKNKGV